MILSSLQEMMKDFEFGLPFDLDKKESRNEKLRRRERRRITTLYYIMERGYRFGYVSGLTLSLESSYRGNSTLFELRFLKNKVYDLMKLVLF